MKTYLAKYTCNQKDIFNYNLKESSKNINKKLKTKIDNLLIKVNNKKVKLVFDKIQKLNIKIRENKKYKNILNYLEAKLHFKLN